MVSYTPSSEDVRLYEIAVLYPYPLNQKEEAELQKGIEAVFEETGGKQIFKDVWGRRGLAYKIGGFAEANFVIYYEEMDPKKIKEVDQQLRLLRGILRHLVIKPAKNAEIRSYADAEKQWKERARLEDAQKVADKEEKLKKQVVEKAKRKQQPERRKETPEAGKPVTGESISQGLEKLISDKDLDI